MQHDSYDHIIRQIEEHREGDGYTLNLTLRTGQVFKDYAPHARGEDYVEIEKPDHPPVWVLIEAIDAIELCS